MAGLWHTAQLAQTACGQGSLRLSTDCPASTSGSLRSRSCCSAGTSAITDALACTDRHSRAEHSSGVQAWYRLSDASCVSCTSTHVKHCHMVMCNVVNQPCRGEPRCMKPYARTHVHTPCSRRSAHLAAAMQSGGCHRGTV